MEHRDGWSPQTRVTVIYLALGITWIVVTDLAVALATEVSLTAIGSQLLKGLGFILITAVVLHLLIERQVRRIRMAELETREIYQRTMRVVTHLMNDHLNAMLYFKLRADESGAIPSQLGREWEDMLFATADRIRRLGEMEVLDPALVDQFIASNPDPAVPVDRTPDPRTPG